MVDVVIVGAGIAGMVAASKLNKDLNIVVIERHSFPHDKVCAGMMRDECIALLDNPPDTIFNSPSPIEFSVDSKILPSMKFHNLNRINFFNWIFENNPNIKIMDETSVESIDNSGDSLIIKTNGKIKSTIESKYIIGADGVGSKTRELFAPSVNIMHSIQYLIKPTKKLNGFEMIHDNDVSSYYIWAVPREDNILVGTGFDGANKILNHAKTKYGVVATIKKESFPIVKIKHIDEVCFGDERIFLVGDAAGLVFPKTGEGIYLAIRSALAAAEAINKSISYSDLCVPIWKELRKEI